MGRSVIYHKQGINDINDRIDIVAGAGSTGNAPTSYNIHLTANLCLHLPFQRGPASMGVNGLTNEVLLAIVADRLEQFQSGELHCAENSGALRHVTLALSKLQRCSRTRKEQGVADTVEKHSTGSRVIKDDTHLRIETETCGSTILLEKLETWAGWSNVEKAVKLLMAHDSDLTEAELDVIKSCATTNAGRHGLQEFLSALNNMRQIKK